MPDLPSTESRISNLERDLALTRAEYAEFRQHAAANLASLNEIVTELTAEVAKDPAFTVMIVRLLRALTFNLGGYEFRGERAPLDWDPDVEFARLAGETEADKPVPVKVPACYNPDDTAACPNPVKCRWHPPGRPGEPVWLCDDHAKDKDLSGLEDLADLGVPW